MQETAPVPEVIADSMVVVADVFRTLLNPKIWPKCHLYNSNSNPQR